MSDPYSANTVLLLHMEGNDGSTTFTDNSLFPKTITRVGDTKISTVQSKWGNGSGYFDGNGDYLTVGDRNLFLDFSKNFTIECWIYPTEISAQERELFSTPYSPSFYGHYLACYNGIAVLGLSTQEQPTIWESEGVSLSGIVVNQWQHLAFCRQGTNLYSFLNGVLKNNKAMTRSPINQTYGSFASLFTFDSLANNAFKGYSQDFRATADIARYTADFTPPAALLPDPDPPTGLIRPSGYRNDIYDGGAFRIVGNVDELGIAGPYRVRLFDRQSARCIRETWSAADGSYSFPYIAYRQNGYFAVAYDHGDNPLNAAIADLITPELMP
jgi:hypothetical protein